MTYYSFWLVWTQQATRTFCFDPTQGRQQLGMENKHIHSGSTQAVNVHIYYIPHKRPFVHNCTFSPDHCTIPSNTKSLLSAQHRLMRFSSMISQLNRKPAKSVLFACGERLNAFWKSLVTFFRLIANYVYELTIFRTNRLPLYNLLKCSTQNNIAENVAAIWYFGEHFSQDLLGLFTTT